MSFSKSFRTERDQPAVGRNLFIYSKNEMFLRSYKGGVLLKGISRCCGQQRVFSGQYWIKYIPQVSNFHVYITTNPKKTTLYIGMTNDLEYRIIEHYLNRGKPKTFAGKYFCYCLVYYEPHHTALGAIDREKELKKWNRKKKEYLINTINPEWRFLNDELGPWPPEEEITERWTGFRFLTKN